MNSDTTYTRTLRRALQAAGSEEKLAEHLRTPLELLHKWLSGELQPPSDVYRAAFDIVRLAITQRISKRLLKRR